MFSTSNRTVSDRVKIFSYTALLKQTGLHVPKGLTGSLMIKAIIGLPIILQQTVLVILASITSVKRLGNRRKNTRFITAHNMHSLTNSFSTNRFSRRTNIVTTICLT